MAEWNIARYDPSYEEPLDPEIIPLCDALNAAGIVTTQSCCGHGHDWPRVWFEHSHDARLEDLARFVIAGEPSQSSRAHFTVFRKEILLEGYLWSLEIHLNNVFRETTKEEGLSEAVRALGIVARLVGEWDRRVRL